MNFTKSLAAPVVEVSVARSERRGTVGAVAVTVAGAEVKTPQSCSSSSNACVPACRGNSWDPAVQRLACLKAAARSARTRYGRRNVNATATVPKGRT